MTYDEMRQKAVTGDVILVRGNRFVRVFTAESVSHVAVLVWMPDDGGLWVFEFVESEGYLSMPASQWFHKRRGQAIYHGIAPDRVHRFPQEVFTAATRYRDSSTASRRYGWLSLVTVWVSQLVRRRLPVRGRVCSTFAQEVWEATGWIGFSRTADPGDFIEVCQRLTPVQLEETK